MGVKRVFSGVDVCATFVASDSHVIVRDHSSRARLGCRVPRYIRMLAFGTRMHLGGNFGAS